MAKETESATFTPTQAADVKQGHQQAQPKEPYAGKEQDKDSKKQKAKSK